VAGFNRRRVLALQPYVCRHGQGSGRPAL